VLVRGHEDDREIARGARDCEAIDDGGRSWELATSAPFPGAAYGLSYALDDDDGCSAAVFAAGPGGAAWSRDEGNTWESLAGATTGYFSVEMANRHRGWLVGAGGSITRIDL
jgi:hypothetical protein